MENSSKKQGNIIAILAMVFLFAMIAFVTNLCSPMAVILKNNFNVSEFLSQVGNYGNFGAYLVMGVPAGLLITKFGYKKTALMALIVGIVGLLLQWVSGSAGFVVYLIGAFISGLWQRTEIQGPLRLTTQPEDPLTHWRSRQTMPATWRNKGSLTAAAFWGGPASRDT